MPGHKFKDSSRIWNRLIRHTPPWLERLLLGNPEALAAWKKFHNRVGGGSGNTNGKSKVKLMVGLAADPYGDFWRQAYQLDIVCSDGRDDYEDAYRWDNLEVTIWRQPNADLLDHSKDPIPPLILEEMRIAEEMEAVQKAAAASVDQPVPGFHYRNKRHTKALKALIELMRHRGAKVTPCEDWLKYKYDGHIALPYDGFRFDIKSAKFHKGFFIAEKALWNLSRLRPEVAIIFVGGIETDQLSFYACWAKDVPIRYIQFFDRPGVCAQQYQDDLKALRARYPKAKVVESKMPPNGEVSGQALVTVEKIFPIIPLGDFMREFFGQLPMCGD